MKQILTGRVTMKPKWYFVVGSISMILGFIGSTIASVFLVSIIAFSLRSHGPMGSIRFAQLVSNFPWWAPFLALLGLGSGIWFLKQNDFSYKKNFKILVAIFIFTIILSGWLMDALGVSASWSRLGPMRRLYQQSEEDGTFPIRGQGWGRQNK